MPHQSLFFLPTSPKSKLLRKYTEHRIDAGRLPNYRPAPLTLAVALEKLAAIAPEKPTAASMRFPSPSISSSLSRHRCLGKPLLAVGRHVLVAIDVHQHG
jgi:hypothetical protein